jgi:hypothetical protein
MNSDLLKRVIADQKEELKHRKNLDLIEREAYSYAKKFLDESIIKVITGVRRCGKSTFCHQLLENKKYAYFNFDDERLLGFGTDELDNLLEMLYIEFPNSEFILFDEIQNINGWELFVNRLSRQGLNIILTGSNSKMLSKELATHLTGRHIQIELFPFSFKEFLKYNNESFDDKKSFSTKKIAKIRTLLNDYIKYGGFPEIRNYENRQRYLRDLFDTIILRDIVERYKIRDASTLKELSVLLINYYSSLVSYNRVSNTLKITSINTTKDFMKYLEETYLLSYVSKHSFKLHEELKSPKKVYTIDTGLLASFGTTLSPNTGRKMENIVYLHERRKMNTISYFSDGKSEVDFVVKNNENEIKLIQVAKDISNDLTLQRETDALLSAKRVLDARQLLLINEDKEDIIKSGNIEINVIPLWKYLIDDSKIY